MRVLVDTNVFVSYLLSPERKGTIPLLVEEVLGGPATLLVPRELLEELFEVLTTRTYLTSRIPYDAAERFIATLRSGAELLPPVHDELPRLLRDPKDDYLLAYALVGRADYLVTGDDDLLSLGAMGRLSILSPAAFTRLLERGRRTDEPR